MKCKPLWLEWEVVFWGGGLWSLIVGNIKPNHELTQLFQGQNWRWCGDDGVKVEDLLMDEDNNKVHDDKKVVDVFEGWRWWYLSSCPRFFKIYITRELNTYYIYRVLLEDTFYVGVF